MSPCAPSSSCGVRAMRCSRPPRCSDDARHARRHRHRSWRVAHQRGALPQRWGHRHHRLFAVQDSAVSALRASADTLEQLEVLCP
jgi:hypothetical protein